MKLSIQRQGFKLKAVSLNIKTMKVALVGRVAKISLGDKFEFKRVGSNFSINAFGYNLKHLKQLA